MDDYCLGFREDTRKKHEMLGGFGFFREVAQNFSKNPLHLENMLYCQTVTSTKFTQLTVLFFLLMSSLSTEARTASTASTTHGGGKATSTGAGKRAYARRLKLGDKFSCEELIPQCIWNDFN